VTPDQAADYRPHLGTSFEVQGHPYALRLESVETFEGTATEGFSLGFSGPRSALLSQGCHPLSHAVLGSLELFLVPVQAPGTDIHAYEAIFNRLRPRAQAPTSGGA